MEEASRAKVLGTQGNIPISSETKQGDEGAKGPWLYSTRENIEKSVSKFQRTKATNGNLALSATPERKRNDLGSSSVPSGERRADKRCHERRAKTEAPLAIPLGGRSEQDRANPRLDLRRA